MSSVTFGQSVGGNGSTFSDAPAPTVGGLAEGGHRTYFFPLLQQVLSVAAFLVAKAQAAADSAASAANAPGTSATTASSVTVAVGSRSVTLNETGKLFVKGQRVNIASSANPLNSVAGPITAFTSNNGAMTINVDTVAGSGTFTDGIVSLNATGGVLPTRQINTGGVAVGGGDLSANRTITVPAAPASVIRAGIAHDQVITPGDSSEALSEVTLSYGTNITTVGDSILDASKFITARVIMGGNATLPNLSNAAPGSYRIAFQQDSTGGRQISAWGNMYRATGGRPALTTTPGAVDYWYIDVINSSEAVINVVKQATN